MAVLRHVVFNVVPGCLFYFRRCSMTPTKTFTASDCLNTPQGLAITEEQSQAERLEELRERVKQAHLDLEPINEEFAWLTAKRQIAMGILGRALADYQKHLETMLAVKF